MKKQFTLCLALLLAAVTQAQGVYITDLSASEVSGGINVNLKTISFNGAGYIGSTYAIDENDITISACYWFDQTLPVPTFDNDIFVPVMASGTYTINVNVYNSTMSNACDYFSLSATGSTTVLSTAVLEPVKDLVIAPNPSNGLIRLSQNLTIGKVGVYDHLGRVIGSFENIQTNELDLRDLAAGTYLLKFETDNGIMTRKVILQK